LIQAEHKHSDRHAKGRLSAKIRVQFHEGHTWARIESGGFICIGMDDFAMKLLGEADGFDLPLIR
jgi:glycine cleavage system H lipoate-binding protein